MHFSSVIFKRGKFRPRLVNLVATNSPEMVEEASTAAFLALPNVKAAITGLTSLQGVGPATASGNVQSYLFYYCPDELKKPVKKNKKTAL